MNMDDKNNLITLMTEALPVLRASLNITQEQLAEEVGMTRQTVTRIENNKTKMTWLMFTALYLFFLSKEKSNELLKVYNIIL